MARGVQFGRKPKLTPFQRQEALKRRAAGETLAEVARSYDVDISTISRLDAMEARAEHVLPSVLNHRRCGDS